MDPTAQHPLTLRFRDAALEREYQARLAAEIKPLFPIVAWLTIGLWIACAGLDPITGGSAANGHVMRLVRLAAVPLLLPVPFLGLASPARFARAWMPMVFGGLIVANVALAAMLYLLPEPERFDGTLAMMGAVLMIPIGYTLWSLPVYLVAAIGVPVTLTQLALLSREFPTTLVPATSFMSLCHVMGILVGYMLERSRRRNFVFARLLAHERERSEGLLRNILPEPVVERLKASPGRIADHFDAVTVLFADIVGFTPLCERLAPDALIERLDDLFSEFDDLAARHGLEKIKTIGDAYMVVGGLPTPRDDHAQAVAAMALEMRARVAAKNLQIRIGIHTGPVVAGVIGKRKFSYDLWGDTVNTASRMESHGIPGTIQISEATRRCLGEAFRVTRRGPVALKGKGELETFLLEQQLDMAPPASAGPTRAA